MKKESTPLSSEVSYDIEYEVSRYFDSKSLPKVMSGGLVKPKFVLILGGPASGKTTMRKKEFSKEQGYVVIDAGEIFNNLSRGVSYPFPGHLEDLLEIIGHWVAEQALREGRNIVMEAVGEDFEKIPKLILALKNLGYEVEFRALTCDVKVARIRNISRSKDNISSYYCQDYQISWMLEEASKLGGV